MLVRWATIVAALFMCQSAWAEQTLSWKAPQSPETVKQVSTENLIAGLKRKRTTDETTRRQVLAAIEADVPNSKGRFSKSPRTEEENDVFDWLAELDKLPKQDGLTEVKNDVLILRELSHRDTEGMSAILKFAFTDDGLIYRDEVGRLLRQREPYSLPALFQAAYRHRSSGRRTYARYQLERLDRENPMTATQSASIDEHLLVKLIEALGTERHREGVHTMFAYVNHQAPAVRAAARKIALSYMEGKPPHKAPKRKLKITGGKLTDEKEPLWLDARELAHIETKKLYEEVMGEKTRSGGAEQLREVFGKFDNDRNAKLQKLVSEALQAADAGQYKTAVEKHYQVLASGVDIELTEPQKVTLAAAYKKAGKAAMQASQFNEAGDLYSMAVSLLPKGEDRDQTQALVYFARAQPLQEAGAPLLRKAEQLAPHMVAREEKELRSQGGKKSLWLWLGLGCAAAALGLALVGLWRSRTSAP